MSAGVRLRQLVRLPCHRMSTAASAHAESVVSEYDQAKPFNDIPGPAGLPYIGTMLLYRNGPFKRYSIDKYQESVLDFHAKYGKIFKETIAGTTIVHMCDPDYIRQVFAADGKVPHIAPLIRAVQMYRKEQGMSLGLGNTNGEEWYRLRSAVQQSLMRPKAIEKYLPVVADIADEFIDRVKQIMDNRGHVPDLRKEISKWNIESATMKLFEVRLHGMTSSDENSEVERLLQAVSDLFTSTTKMKFQLPLYLLFKTPTWKLFGNAEGYIHEFTHKYLDQTLNKIDSLQQCGELQEGQYSLLTYLLSRKELDHNDIATLTVSLLTDGLSTTSPTLASALYCVARHTDAQEKLCEEIARVVPPGEQITVEMINSMPYLKAFVKEVMRFFPIGLDVARLSQQDLVIGGYQIPAGTYIELNNFLMFQKTEYFEEPEKFKAERWLRDGSAQNIHPFILTPFSHGPRMCVGRRFAEQEMYVVIVKMLQNFRLEWKHKDLGQKYQILMVPDAPVDIAFHKKY